MLIDIGNYSNCVILEVLYYLAIHMYQENNIQFKDWWYQLRQLGVSVYVLLSAVLLLAAQLYPDHVNKLRPPALAMVAAGSNTFTAGVKLFEEVKIKFANIIDVYKENAYLRQYLDTIERDYLYSHFVLSENQSLRELLQVHTGKYKSVTTTRIAGDTSSVGEYRAVIAAGTEEGVTPGMIAVSQHGVVGLVYNTLEKASEILLITSQDSHIPVVTEQSRLRAIASGANKGELTLNYGSHKHYGQLSQGELVFTSGDGKIYPAGLVVGVITFLNNKPVVRPLIDWHSLGMVRIIGPDTGKGEETNTNGVETLPKPYN